MKKQLSRKTLLVLLALVLCVSSLSGCISQEPEPTESSETKEYMQLLGFESYEEVTGTKIAIGNMLGEMGINTDKAYITQGDASLMINVQGDYSRPANHPYFKLDFLNTTCATRDFSDFKSVSFDVYNATDKELHIKLNILVGNEDGDNIGTTKEEYALAPNAWTTCVYDLSQMAAFSLYDFTTVRYMVVEFMEHKQNRDDATNTLYFDNLIGTFYAEGEAPEPIDFDFFEGIDFETAGQEFLISGQGVEQDATIERVSYADLGITSPTNGGSYALKVSHTSNEYPTFRINFGTTLKAGTRIIFDACAITDGSAISLMLADYEWQQVAYLTSDWRISSQWEVPLLEDCSYIDLVWERRNATEVPSSIIIDNIVVVEPEPEPEPVDPVGDITAGLDFETEGNEGWFVKTGSLGSDATVERVSYADLGIDAPADGGNYALKLSHSTYGYPTVRLEFGKTLKAGTRIKFDAYAITDGDAISLMLEDYSWQQVAYLINGWREDLNWEVTLLADCDHIDLVWERRNATEVSSSIIIDNIVAIEPEPQPEPEPEPDPGPAPADPVGDITAGLDFETSGNELWFVGAGESSDATVERVPYSQLGVLALADGGSYALKISHKTEAYPTFRINFGKTLKAGTQIRFDAFAITDGSAISLMLQDHEWKQVAYLVSGWREDLNWEVTLLEDCDHIDLVWEQRGNTNIASSIIIDNIVAIEPSTDPEPDPEPTPADPVGDITAGLDFETEGHELWFVGAGENSDATVERVSYADIGIAGPANGGSYALKVSHTSKEFPTFRINFGKTLKAGTQIKFDAYAITDGSAISLMLQDHQWKQVAYLVSAWREGLNWEVTLLTDCDHIDLVWERRDAKEVPSSIIIDNIVATEP